MGYRYLLFKFDHYYPSGGWNDFAGFFDTIEDAKSAVDNSIEHAHIVDTESDKIVARFQGGDYNVKVEPDNYHSEWVKGEPTWMGEVDG